MDTEHGHVDTEHGHSDSTATETITIQEAAQKLGVSSKTIRRYIESGKLEKMQDGGRVYVLVSEVDMLQTVNGNGSTGDVHTDVHTDVHEIVHTEVAPLADPEETITLPLSRYNCIIAQIGALEARGQYLEAHADRAEERENRICDLEREAGRLEEHKAASEEKDKALTEARERIAKLERENGQLEGELRAVKNRPKWWEGFWG